MNRSNRNSNSSSAQSNESPINRQSYILMFLRDVLSREESKEENTGRDLLNIMINRTGRSQRASTEENKANNEEALIRRIRSRRYHYFDDQAESADELINPLPDEEYIDFRTYPLSIDWKEVENDESAAYEVFDKFGYFGVSCFTTLSKNNQIKFNEKILKNILDYYVKNFELNTAESIRKIENLINNLPSLDNIKQILILRLVSNKELVPVKLVLDLYEHYYKNFEAPLYNIFINEYIPVALMFYTTLSDEDLNFTYEKIIEEKEIYEILKNNLKFHLSKKRKSYIKYFNKLNNDLMKLVSGINLSHLII